MKTTLIEIPTELSKEIQNYCDVRTRLENQMYQCTGISVKKKRKWWQFWRYLKKRN